MEGKLKLNLIIFELEFNLSKIIDELRILLKFNILLLPAMAAGFAAAAYAVSRHLTEDAEEDALGSARLMLESARAMRTYTTTQVAPLLDQEQAKRERSAAEIARSAANLEQVLDVELLAEWRKAAPEHTGDQELHSVQSPLHTILATLRREQRSLTEREFFPQSIPFFAATEAFGYFREKYPDFAYKEAASNPTNPRDRTLDWEADIVNDFRNHPLKAEFAGRRDAPGGSSLYLAAPIRVESEDCLTCHGPAEKAPPEIVRLYGAGNGFGWKLGDVAGAQIISVPANVAHNRAFEAAKTLLKWLGGIFFVLYLIVNGITLGLISRLMPARAMQ